MSEMLHQLLLLVAMIKYHGQINLWKKYFMLTYTSGEVRVQHDGRHGSKDRIVSPYLQIQALDSDSQLEVVQGF